MSAHDKRLLRLMRAAAAATSPIEAMQCVKDAYNLALEGVEDIHAETPFTVAIQELHCDGCQPGKGCDGRTSKDFDALRFHEYVVDRGRDVAMLMLQELRR